MVEEWAKKVVDAGAGEILLTSVERDGTMQGYDIELIRRVTSCVSVPVIASGGAGNYEHMREAVMDGGASLSLRQVFIILQSRLPGRQKNIYRNTGWQSG